MRKRFTIGGFAASVLAAAILAAGVVAPGASAHACTPGFYKNHEDVTAALIAKGGLGNTLGSVFGATGSFANVTILDALSLQGGPGVEGALEILYRAAAAAYLNSIAEPNWPGPSTANLIAGVKAVVATGDRDTILGDPVAGATVLDNANNTGGCGKFGPGT